MSNQSKIKAAATLGLVTAMAMDYGSSRRDGYFGLSISARKMTKVGGANGKKKSKRKNQKASRKKNR